MEDDQHPHRKRIKVLLHEPDNSPFTTRVDPLRISSLLNSPSPSLPTFDGLLQRQNVKQSAVTPLPSVSIPFSPPKMPVVETLPPSIMSTSGIKILEDPDPYQISNYKIQPTFTVELHCAPESSCIMKVELVDCRTHQVIQKAFVSGDLQPVVPDARAVTFSKLKLNRMKQLKEETEKYAIIIKDSSFYLRVSMGQLQIVSTPFRIVSTFNQLPKEFQSLRNSRSTKAFEKS